MSLCARVPDVQGGARGRGDAKAARLSHCPFISGCFVKATWGQESSAGPALLPRPEEQRLTTALPGLTQKSKQASHQGCLFSINHNLGTKRSECRCSWETHTQGLGGLLFGSGPTSDTSRVQSGGAGIRFLCTNRSKEHRHGEEKPRFITWLCGAVFLLPFMCLQHLSFIPLLLFYPL